VGPQSKVADVGLLCDPVRIGDTIHTVVTPVQKRPTQKPGRGVVSLRFEVKNQHGAVIQVGTATLLMKMKTT
jgi:acyl dehydratase